VILSALAATIALATPSEPLLKIDAYHGSFGELVEQIHQSHGVRLRIPARWKDEIVFVHLPEKSLSEFLDAFTEVTGARWAEDEHGFTLLSSETPASWRYPERNPLLIGRIQETIDRNLEQLELESNLPKPDPTALQMRSRWKLAREIGAEKLATIRPGETALFVIDGNGQARRLFNLREFNGEGRLIAATDGSFAEALIEDGELIVEREFEPGRIEVYERGEEISHDEFRTPQAERWFQFTYRANAILDRFDQTVAGSENADLLLTLHSAEVLRSLLHSGRSAFAWLTPYRPTEATGFRDQSSNLEVAWHLANRTRLYWQVKDGWVLCRPEYSSDQWQQLASPSAIRKLFKPGKELPLQTYFEALSDLPPPVMERTAFVLHSSLLESIWDPALDIRPAQLFATLSSRERVRLLRDRTITISLDQREAQRGLVEHWLNHTRLRRYTFPLAQTKEHHQVDVGWWAPDFTQKSFPNGIPPGATLSITWRPKTFTYLQPSNTIRGVLFMHPSLQEFAKGIATHRMDRSAPDPLSEGILSYRNFVAFEMCLIINGERFVALNSIIPATLGADYQATIDSVPPSLEKMIQDEMKKATKK